MAPDEQACKLIATKYSAQAQLAETIKSATSVINQIIELFGKFKWGKVTLALPDSILAEFYAAASGMASGIAASLLGSVSSFAAKILEMILSEILKIVLCAPTALFSLVSIPQKVAIDKLSNERKLLMKARSDIQVLINFINKWMVSLSGSKYYNQMKEAIPYVNKALNLCQQIFKELGGVGDGSVGKPALNAYFNESKYKELQTNLDQAILLTSPKSSFINARGDIFNKVKMRKVEIMREKSLKINKDFEGRRNNIIHSYKNASDANVQKTNTEASRIDGIKPLPVPPKNSSAMVKIGASVSAATKNIQKKIDTSVNNAKSTVKDEQLKNGCAFQLRQLSARKEEALIAADIEAEVQANSEAAPTLKDFTNGLDALQADFTHDLKNVSNAIGRYCNNVASARTQYNGYKTLCNTIFNSKEMISNLLAELVKLMHNTTNKMSKVVLEAFDEAETRISVAKDLLDTTTLAYERDDGGTSPTVMVSKLSMANALLISADLGLNSVVTRSFIDLINGDEKLTAEGSLFTKFTERVGNIPGWSGINGEWLSSNHSPYTQLIFDSISLLSLVPVMSLSPSAKDRSKALAMVKRAQNTFSTLLSHNGVVTSAVTSYTPYVGNDAANLTRILSKMGFLNTFASGFSILSIVLDIGDMFAIPAMALTIPNYMNCSKAYPELFSSDSVAAQAAMEKNNLRNTSCTTESLKQNDENAQALCGIKMESSSLKVWG